MSFKLVTTKEGGTEVQALLEKGFECTINGLEVVFLENLHFKIKNATNLEQAVEFCTIQGVPVDFSHFDHEKGVDVRYNSHGTRIETAPVVEEVVEAAPAKAPKAKGGKKADEKQAETPAEEPEKTEDVADVAANSEGTAETEEK